VKLDDEAGTIPLEGGLNTLMGRAVRAAAAGLRRLSLRRPDGRTLKLALIGAGALAVLALGWWSLSRRTIAENLIDGLRQAPLSTSIPVEMLPSAGSQLVISAIPWGEVVRVVDSSGAEMALPADRATPLLLPVVPGRYRVEIANPYSDEPQFCHPEISETSSEPCRVEFFSLDSVAYFKEAGWWP